MEKCVIILGIIVLCIVFSLVIGCMILANSSPYWGSILLHH
ncbi:MULTISPECIES: hypothetical protein [Sarcina]|nr:MULTISPECIES: hypothetical protein [Sarcina]